MAKCGLKNNFCSNKRFYDELRQQVPPITQSTIYFENFDSSAVSVSPGPPQYKYPAGWTTPAGDPSDPTTVEWQVYDDGGAAYPYSNDVAFGLPGASGLRSLAFSNGAPQTEITTTKPFSTIGKTGITLEFLMFIINGAPAMTIEWSDDNLNWNNLAYTPPTADSTWHQVNPIALPVGAENKATIYLKLSVIGNGSGNFLVIDDLRIKGYS